MHMHGSVGQVLILRESDRAPVLDVLEGWRTTSGGGPDQARRGRLCGAKLARREVIPARALCCNPWGLRSGSPVADRG